MKRDIVATPQYPHLKHKSAKVIIAGLMFSIVSFIFYEDKSGRKYWRLWKKDYRQSRKQAAESIGIRFVVRVESTGLGFHRADRRNSANHKGTLG